MKANLYDRLLQRELGDGTRYSKVRGIYGDRKWVHDLDIVNELDGHSGCVNALSWSRSGRLLASGSDDRRVNIHAYLPESSTSHFNLTTSIITGHTQNIFSVKFMPFSNDRTVVTAAGDGEVRIFDIEHSGHSSSQGSSASGPPRSGRVGVGLHGLQDGVRLLSEGDTNAKVFRSHSDRVKRIVTESSPFYFLTCSEDGEVRQWDTRLPSSAYPAHRDHLSPRWASQENVSDVVPPPLISYKKYNLDLNTISCSPSQPHYIALGGAHLHCFLHDRRMLGRDKLAERGAKLASPENWSEHDDELMGQATRCVRKFAPNGQQRMRRTDNGHITACKISDANPNEMIVSWSGEWIYSFDLIRSSDATEMDEQTAPGISNGVGNSRTKESKARKRKRPKSGSMLSQEGLARAGSRPRTESRHESEERMALMVQYENGQSEEIPIEAPPRAHSPLSEVEAVRESVLSETQLQSHNIAKSSVKIRKNLFALGQDSRPSAVDLVTHAESFTAALGLCASILPEMDDIARTWRYPVNPSELDVAFQRTLRENRASARRFVQAAGTLARVLGGRLQMGGNSNAVVSQYFTSIKPAPNELPLPRYEQFGYDFLKAILLWLDSGIGAVLEEFSSASRSNPRLPIEKDASVDAVDEVLIPYLLELAGTQPIFDVDASRFEVDENRVIFASERDAVAAFARIVKIPFADLSSAAVAVVESSEAGSENTSPSSIEAQDRRTAIKYWAFRVGRGLLMNAGHGVNYAFVDRAFGGIGRPDSITRSIERRMNVQREDIDPNEEDDIVVSARMIKAAEHLGERARRRGQHARVENEATSAETSTAGTHSGRSNELSSQSSHSVEPEAMIEEEESDDDSDGDINPEESEDDDEEDESSDEEGGHPRLLWRSGFDRSRFRERVEADIPCSSHTRQYRGHCNVKTVKDVNFYGLQDEYVVSGSDSGHIFIWDRKTSQLLNILEGDGEVVNVVQGHPYEPVLAVSGIDHTIKIFSPDAQAREDARKGVGVRPGDVSTFSSLGLGRSRRRQRPSAPRSSEPAVPQSTADESGDEDAEENIAPNGLSTKKRMHEEYQITSRNDVDRRGGNRDAFLTRAMLAQIAARLHTNEDGEEVEGEVTGPIILSDDCTVM